MSKQKTKEQLPVPTILATKEPTINRIHLCVATEINHQMVSSVSKDKFVITMIDSFVVLHGQQRILIPLTNIASIHFD